MEKTDVLVIGGSAAGIVAATTGKSFYPDKDFLVIRKEKQVLVPCGIPYIFGTLMTSNKDIIPDKTLLSKGIRINIDEVTTIDQENKRCKTAKGNEISFEKLVIATGSSPVEPIWLKGSKQDNVYSIPKNKKYLDTVKSDLDDCENIVVIGGGFIGVEIADELCKQNKYVTIVELMPHILGLAFDDDLTIWAEDILESRGINIITGVGVSEILGNGNNIAAGVRLSNEREIGADAVILSIGYRPNTSLAEKSGITVNDKGFIKVNEYMQTENKDIFAVGDCAEKSDFFTGKSNGAMLASISCAEARIAGMNLFNLSDVKNSSGTLPVFCTVIGEYAFGAAGINENMARKEGVEIITGTFEGIDKHPGTLPMAQEQIVKLIANRETGILIGGEVIGGASTGELTNIIGYAIQNRMAIETIVTTQIGTHPLLTAPPTAYPVIKAAEIVFQKRMNGG